MQEIIFRFDPRNPPVNSSPATAVEARRRLEEGNRSFARLLQSTGGETSSCVIPLDPSHFGVGDAGDAVPRQEPFAAVLSCSDARVPTELLFNQAGNDLFVTRVAGNVLGDECLGSLQYASAHLESVRLFVVLGHSACGAVTAAVDSFLDPARFPLIASTQSIRSIVGSLVISVSAAAKALEEAWGKSVAEQPRYRQALIETTVAIHAALTAWTLERELRATGGDPERSGVVYGVYDLTTHYVRLPLTADGDADAGLYSPPADSTGLDQQAGRIASGEMVRKILEL